MKRNSKGGDRKRWWDEECREEKKKVRKELRDWKKGRGDGERSVPLRICMRNVRV